MRRRSGRWWSCVRCLGSRRRCGPKRGTSGSTGSSDGGRRDRAEEWMRAARSGVAVAGHGCASVASGAVS
eukprot:3521082-Prymnesium_polylepis.1